MINPSKKIPLKKLIWEVNRALKNMIDRRGYPAPTVVGFIASFRHLHPHLLKTLGIISLLSDRR